MLPNWIYYFIGKKSAKSDDSGISKFVLPTGIKFNGSTLQQMPSEFDYSQIIDGQNCFTNCTNLNTFEAEMTSLTNARQMFRYCRKLESVKITTPKCTNFEYCFDNCSLLQSIEIDTSSATTFNNFFSNCSALVNIPILNVSNVKTINNMVAYCDNLSNDSIQNILKMILQLQNYNYSKNLKYVGLNQTQAQTATTFSEWSELVSLGWSTGY